MTSTVPWPDLPLEEWDDTLHTLHRWTQIVGKIRLAQTPWINHSWHVPLYITSRGLTTSPIPYADHIFELTFDFIDHALVISRDNGSEGLVSLEDESVADFHDRLFDALASLDVRVDIHGRPNEVEDPIPFAEDRKHASYDPVYANRFWRLLTQSYRVFQQFRARFIGKCSPIHFFWGSFDLAVTRFSGRTAPAHPGGIPNLPDWVTREAYSHEVSSAGFYPGGGPHPFPFYYSYAYPEPGDYSAADIQPNEAFYSSDLGEYILPYDAVRKSDAPDAVLLSFLQTTYDAAADLGSWDRPALERQGDPRDAN